ncbi:MAG: aldo/keto reductase [Clostridia bacterium]|nr:aldo/keto reductase [Clostridia bacterium]
MKKFYLQGTDIVTVKNAFGALPVQRRSIEDGAKLLRAAFDGGMTYFDTARAYSDSEEKIGVAFAGVPRDRYYIATKTAATTPEAFFSDLHTSLTNLKTDYVDVYQFHQATRVYCPGDGTGMYEAMQEAKRQGKIRFISITSHRIEVAESAVKSGLYATLQFPFSYLASERELALSALCKDNNVGFIAMKALAGGLINNAKAAFAFIDTFDNVLPIWGVQKQEELDEWLSFFKDSPAMSDEIQAFIEEEKKALSGSFCRSCGYCMPCPMGIQINQCARMSHMIRRAPQKVWLGEYWQNEMKKIPSCINCRKCVSKCPYSLSVPELLKANYEDYFAVLSGKTKI